MKVKLRYHRFVSERAWDIIQAAVDTALKRAGNGVELKKQTGVAASTISRWRTRTRLPTIEQAVQIEKVTGVSRKSLRPDVDWDHLDVGNEIS